MRLGHVLTLGWMALTASALGACSNPQPDREICSPVLSQEALDKVFATVLARPSSSITDTRAAVLNRADQCVRRWGYRLAKSKEPIETVAKAVLAACNPEITAVGAPRYAAGCLDCRSADDLAIVLNERARLSIVQGRLGDCAVAHTAADRRGAYSERSNLASASDH